MKFIHSLVIGLCIIVAGVIVAFALRGQLPMQIGNAFSQPPEETEIEAETKRLLGKWQDQGALASVTYEFMSDGNILYRTVILNQVIAWKVVEPGRLFWEQPNVLVGYVGGESNKTYATYEFISEDELKIEFAVGNTNAGILLKRIE